MFDNFAADKTQIDARDGAYAADNTSVLPGAIGEGRASAGDDEIEDRFFLLGRMEILNMLNELIHRRTAVTVYFNGGREFILTTLLEARPDALIFDLGGDKRANRRLEDCQSFVFVSHPAGIRVQFSASGARRFSWGGKDAFWVRLPEQVVRMQRRESYRIVLPLAHACKVRMSAEDGQDLGEWPSYDLSVGGLGMTITGDPPFEPEDTIARIQLALPKLRQIECSAIVRHVTRLADCHNKKRYRLGLSFVGLTPALGVAIQCYIVKLEHERHNMTLGS